MSRVDRGARVILIAGLMLVGASLDGCGGSGGSAASPIASFTGAMEQASSVVTLSWQPPTENADGSPLTDLQGYRVHYGLRSGVYTDTIELTNAGLTLYVVQNLLPGTYYFALSAYNTAGVESSLSPEVAALVN